MKSFIQNDETFMNSKHAFLCEDQKLCLYSR